MARSTGIFITLLAVVFNAIPSAHALTPSKECLRAGGNIETCLRGVASDPVAESVVNSFKEAFGTDPAAVFLAPGRVNLIGEHTDYNDGFVMPCAINYHMVAAVSPSDDDDVIAVATDYKNEQSRFSLSNIEKVKEPFWSNYIRGVCKVLKHDRGLPLRGMRIAIGGNVPQGAGLSSSAALEVALGSAANHLFAGGLGPREVALTGQKAEHWVGCNCGIMDQLISAVGRGGHAVMIDCRDLSTQPVQIPDGYAVVIVNSNFKHALAGLDSEYNSRRAQCEAAARHYGVTALRDVTSERLVAGRAGLDEETYKRARHVVTENERTVAAAAALRAGDMVTMGRLMAESHVSMRDDFEITVPPIDALVDIVSAVLASSPGGGGGGVRMTGGGFGGSVVCLAPEALVPEIKATVEREYPLRSGGLHPTVLVCTPSDGAHRLA